MKNTVKLPAVAKIPSQKLALPIMTIPGLKPPAPKPPAASEDDPTIDEVVDGLRTTFMERAKAEEKRVELVTDTEFWCCFCFETRAQKDAFLKALDLWKIGDKYINGFLAAKALGVDLGTGVRWPKAKRLSERLKKHVDDAG